MAADADTALTSPARATSVFPVDPVMLRVSWMRADEDDPRRAVESREFVIKVNTGPQPKTQTIWIGEPIRDFAVSFGPAPTRVQIVEATVTTRP